MTQNKKTIDWQSTKDFLNGDRSLGNIIFSAPEMSSTQNEAKKAARAGISHGTVFVTDFQTSGHGRRERTWSSIPGTDLTFSVVLRPDAEARYVHMLNLAAALSVKTVLRNIFGGKKNLIEIKWPNDVMVSGKKICGILCETAISSAKPDYAILGMGVNVNGTPEKLPPPDSPDRPEAASIFTETGNVEHLPRLLGKILTKLEHFSKLIEKEAGRQELLEIYRNNCSTLGRKVRIITDSGVFIGVPSDITDEGALVLEDGSAAFHAADVMHVDMGD